MPVCAGRDIGVELVSLSLNNDRCYGSINEIRNENIDTIK